MITPLSGVFPSESTMTWEVNGKKLLFSQLQKNSGMMGSRTTLYHPEGNGQVERMNRTLLQILRTLTEGQKSNWKESLNKLMFAYKHTK